MTADAAAEPSVGPPHAVQLDIRLRFTRPWDAAGKPAAPPHEIAAERTARLRFTVPEFKGPFVNGEPTRVAMFPVELEGGLAACVAVTEVAPSYMAVRLINRWQLVDASTDAIQELRHDVTFDGKLVEDSFAWDAQRLAATVTMIATSTSEAAPEAALQPFHALRGCIDGLEPRVLASLEDI